MQSLRLFPGQSIQEAIDAPDAPSHVLLSPGVYHEKLRIRRPGLLLEGEPGATITFADYANAIHPADGLAYNTFRTYTAAILAPHVTLRGLTIENTAGDPVHKGQSVALSVYGDHAHIERCTLRSTQDTLFLGPLPDDLILRYDGFLPDEERYFEGEMHQLLTHCRIEGSVDFVFGCADAWFYRCELVSVNDTRDTGYVAAPAHALKQSAGFHFLSCRFSGIGMQEESVYLARPWRDFGKAVFVDCELGAHIHPAGFDKWNDTTRDRTARFALGGATQLSQAVPWASVLTTEETETLQLLLAKRIHSVSASSVSPSNK